MKTNEMSTHRRNRASFAGMVLATALLAAGPDIQAQEGDAKSMGGPVNRVGVRC